MGMAIKRYLMLSHKSFECQKIFTKSRKISILRLKQPMTTWNVDFRVIYRCKDYKLICNTYIDCIKVRMDQWEQKKFLSNHM